MMKYSQNMDSPYLTMPDAREYVTKTRTYAGPIDANLLYTSVLNPGQKQKQLQMKVPMPMLNYYNNPHFFNGNGKVKVPTVTEETTRKESVSQQNELQSPKIDTYVVKPNEILHSKLGNSAGPECRYFVCNIVKASESSKIMLECKCKQDNANSNNNSQKIMYKLNVPKKEDRSASSPELHDYTAMLHDLERALNQEVINKK
ncbi:hypothetical protein JYU34_018796 [Plutella xylostella]|uniref:Uncharacterized protein n=1 Tax=Plutella xylostella TaxID=51655 RepID=A0ABQ7PZY3_PLUXY|nr:hypothetical protein JYU34_018796 [Plutella xylostella]